MGKIVNRNEFAAIIGKSGPRVTQLIAEGLPVERTGTKGREVRIDTEQGINWLIAREISRQLGVGEEGTRAMEETGLIRARRIKTETEAGQLQGQLVPLAEARQAFAAALVIIAAQLDGLGGRLASDLADMTNPAEIRELLLDECRRIRNAAADRLADFAVDPGDEPAPEIATEAGGVAMGGS